MHRVKSIEHASVDYGRASECDVVFKQYRSNVLHKSKYAMHTNGQAVLYNSHCYIDGVYTH